MAFTTLQASAAGGVFVKGLDAFTEYNPGQEGATLSFTTKGRSFKAVALWYGSSVSVAVEDDSGQRTIIYKDGAPSGGSELPKIGFSGSTESKSNSYIIGVHDFTNNGNAELTVAVTDGSDGIAIYVFEYDGYNWKPVGSMVTKGKGLGGCRIFRQALTMKDRSGVLYTWTCHGGRFDFLSSDKVNDPSKLY